MATHDININAKVNNSVSTQTTSAAANAMRQFTTNTSKAAAAARIFYLNLRNIHTSTGHLVKAITAQVANSKTTQAASSAAKAITDLGASSGKGAGIIRTFWMAVNGSTRSQFGVMKMLGKYAGVAAAAYIALRSLNDAAKELADTMKDSLDVYSENARERSVEESQGISSKKQISSEEGERETLKLKIAEQTLEDLRATRDRLVKQYTNNKDAPMGVWSLGWEKTKGVFTDNYFDQKKALKEQLDEVTKQIQNQEAIKNAAKRASEKYWGQVGEQMAEKIQNSPEFKVLDDIFNGRWGRDEQEGEWKLYQSEAPVWLQEELSKVVKHDTIKAPNWSSFINQMDKIGGYMSTFTQNIGQDRQLDEMRKQTTKLDQIANNTKNINTKSRYA